MEHENDYLTELRERAHDILVRYGYREPLDETVPAWADRASNRKLEQRAKRASRQLTTLQRSKAEFEKRKRERLKSG